MYAKANPDFFQIRYIDQKGKERVRIDRKSSKETPFIVSREKLQDKSNRYYFKDSLSKTLEEVWFSALDLNIENGKIQTPYIPTIRAVLPIKKEGSFGGILIINYFMKNFIDDFTDAPLYDMIIYNNKGHTLYHYDDKEDNHAKSWGNSLSHKYSIQEEFPREYNAISSQTSYQSNTFVTKKLDLPILEGINLLLKLKKSYFLKQQKSTQKQYLVVSIVVFIFSLLMTYIIIRIFSKKLLNIETLNRLNESLHVASKVAKIGFWEIEFPLKELTWSEGVYDIFEIEESKDKMSYEMFLSFLPYDEREKLHEHFEASIQKREEYLFIHKIVTSSGKTKFVEERGKHYYDDQGNIRKTVGSIYDITTRYYSEEKFKSLLTNASDGVHILDMEGNIVEFSHSFAESLGYSYDEINSLKLKDWDTKASENDMSRMIEELITSPYTFETQHTKKDGSVIDVQITVKGMEINGSRYLYASQRDITEENRIKKEQKSLLSLFDIGDAVLLKWHNDQEHSIAYVSDNILRLLGYTKEDFLEGRVSYAECIHEEDRERVFDDLETLKKRQERFIKHEPYRVWSKEGKEKWVLNYTVVEKNIQEEVAYFISYLIDMTEMKEQEKEIIETSEKLSKVNTKLLDMNDVLNTKEKEISDINKNLEKLVDEKTQENFKQFQLLQEQSKLAAMGEMVGAIAHQWRQPLNILSILVQNMEEDYKDGMIDAPYIESLIEKSEGAITFMSQTIDNLMKFFRVDREKERFNVKENIEAVLSLLKVQLTHHLIDVKIVGEGFEVKGYENEFKQVILNIINNAKDALGETHVPHPIIEIVINKDQRTIEISDNGGGIPKKVINRIFEPYFTTKEQGKGTGIGLYLAKTIIENMKGKLRSQNREEGATFIISFNER